jgi:uncharacterized membrane protein
MLSKKIKILYFISFSIFITYVLILYLNYSEISEIVSTHINIKGETDGYGKKNSLWITSSINLVIILVIGFLIKNPHLANYPNEITNENRESMYRKMQLFLVVLGIIATSIFSYMVFKALNYGQYFIYLVSYLIISPLITLIYFKNE